MEEVLCDSKVIGLRACQITTVKLDAPKGATAKGHPVWFETRITGGEYDGYIKTYTTERRAWTGHQRIVRGANKGKVDYADNDFIEYNYENTK